MVRPLYVEHHALRAGPHSARNGRESWTWLKLLPSLQSYVSCELLPIIGDAVAEFFQISVMCFRRVADRGHCKTLADYLDNTILQLILIGDEF